MLREQYCDMNVWPQPRHRGHAYGGRVPEGYASHPFILIPTRTRLGETYLIRSYGASPIMLVMHYACFHADFMVHHIK